MTDHYAQTSLLLPMNGANNGTVFTDWSPVPKTVTRAGVTLPTTVTAQSKFYGSSGFFGASTGAQAPPHLRYTLPAAIGTQAFTIRGWMRVANTSELFVLYDSRYPTSSSSVVNDDSGGFVVSLRGASSAVAFTYATSTRIDGVTAFSANTWHHVEASRDGSGNLRMFLDGNLEITQAGVSNSFDYLYTAIGGFAVNFAQGEHYIQDFELTIGAALHTANFPPPTRLLGTISNAAVGAGKILDRNGNQAERTVFAVPRSYMGNNAGVARIWSTTSNASGEFEIQAPAGVEHSVIALSEGTPALNDQILRVIPA